MPRYLFNASNIRTGGGVQVATSVICEWADFDALPDGLEIIVSTEVDANVRSIGCDTKVFSRYRVVDTFGLSAVVSRNAWEMRKFQSVFTLFGPLYQIFFYPYNITGFAQPWISSPSNEVSRRMPLMRRVMSRAKFWVQEWFFRKADLLVVELEHVAVSLVGRSITSPECIRVVHNCLGSIYEWPARWLPLTVAPATKKLKIGFVGRNYPHKNTAILPQISRVLALQYKLEVDFFVTFTDSEWAACNDEFRDVVSNMGALAVAQCPSFYQAMDAIIFPSLLECFSATPLEALAMGKPLFASDRPFNRDVCGEHAIYFDPLDARDAAQKIAQYFLSSARQARRLDLAREHAMKFSNARERAATYLSLLINDHPVAPADRLIR